MADCLGPAVRFRWADPSRTLRGVRTRGRRGTVPPLVRGPRHPRDR
jgi:hypothetical protein